MKTNTSLSIEVYGLLIGLLGAQLIGLAFLFIPSLSSNASSYADKPGVVLISMLVIVGVIGSVFFVFNISKKLSALWQYRLAGFAVFYVALALINVLSR